MDTGKRKEKERRQKRAWWGGTKKKVVEVGFKELPSNYISFCPLLESLICNEFSPIVVNWLWLSFPRPRIEQSQFP